MTNAGTTVDHLWTAFQTLPPESKDEFLGLLFGDEKVRREMEDLLDLSAAEVRSREPSRSLADVLAELGR